MTPVRRRDLLQLALLCGLAECELYSGALAADQGTASAALADWLRHPLLTQTLYRHGVSTDYDQGGAAGANRPEYRWIEEQRQGAEWIVRGYAVGNADWIALGWRELDWGIAHQQSDGGFDSRDPFHSTSFFVEALGRSCLIDPSGATPERVQCVRRAAHWLMASPAAERGIISNRPYTHRRYILAAALGQAGRVTGDQDSTHRAAKWADEGLALQEPDGTNPEKGGFDAGYQMVGVLMALRYLPVCGDHQLRERLHSMIRSAVTLELTRQNPDGSIDPSGSTRIEKEHSRAGNQGCSVWGDFSGAGDWCAGGAGAGVARCCSENCGGAEMVRHRVCNPPASRLRGSRPSLAM